jgi:hypothetical protein
MHTLEKVMTVPRRDWLTRPQQARLFGAVQEVKTKSLPSRHPIRGGQVDEAPTVVRDGIPDDQGVETEETENKVPVDLDKIIIKRRIEEDKHDQGKLFETIKEVPASNDRQDDEAAQVRDAAQAGVCDAQAQKKLFEAVTEVLTANDSPARPKRSVKLTPRCGQDDYSPKEDKPSNYGQDDYSPIDYKPIDNGQDDHSPSNYSPEREREREFYFLHQVIYKSA